MADKMIWWKIAASILALLLIILFSVLRSADIIDWSWGWISVPILLLVGEFIYWLFYGIGETTVDVILLLLFCYLYKEK